MATNICVDIYQVEFAGDLGEVIRSILEDVEDDDSRTTDINGVPTRLQQVQRSDDFGWEGEFVRIRLNNLPSRTKLSGAQTDLELDDDEGLGENTAFLFDPKKKHLLVQTFRSSVTASAMRRYFSEFTGKVGPVFLHPVLRKDAMERLARLSESKKLVIQVAADDRMQGYDTENDAVESVLKLAKYLRSPSIEVTASIGHRGGSLSPKRVFAAVKELLKMGDTTTNRVEKLKVAGDKASQLIDVLEFKLKYIEKVKEKGRALTRMERRDALRAIWARARKEGEI